MQTGNGGLPGPLRRFSDRLDAVRSADVVDMDQVGKVLVELAGDEKFFAPPIAQLPAGNRRPGRATLTKPRSG